MTGFNCFTTLFVSVPKFRQSFQVATTIILASTSLPSLALTYNITNLGTLGGVSAATAISDNGIIVGESETIDGTLHATLFNAGSAPTALTTGFSRAFGVNNSGQIVGLATFSPSATDAALFNSSNGAIDLGALGPYGSQANAINNNGRIVGISSTPNNGPNQAILFNADGTKVNLGSLGNGYSNAFAINNNDQIVGVSSNGHATLFSPGVSPIDLGVLAGYDYSSAATGINDNGQIVGVSSALAGDYASGFHKVDHATLFSNGSSPIDLGTLGGTWSHASGINNQGQIVGYSAILGDLQSHAAIFEAGGAPIDLNNLIDPNSGWTLSYATAINANGAIVGSGILNGRSLAFLATPVPVPAAVWLFGSGMGMFMLNRRRKKYT